MRVCKEWFPNEEHPEKSGFFMDDRLVLQLNVLLKNIINDWDFTIIISGQGEVRVGKSMLAMQIACYWSYEIQRRYGHKVPFSVEENFIFEGSKLIKQGNELGKRNPYSALVFDEAGADLEGKKVMRTSTQNVLDFFRECGQYNLLNILVLPDFFELPKGIAMTRSIFLIDVFYEANEEAIFERGKFNFYSRRSKKWLYLQGKKNLDYSQVKSDFGSRYGKFFKFYPINEEEYKKKKQEALKNRETKTRSRFQVQRDACMWLLAREPQTKPVKIGKPLMTLKQLGQRLEQLTGIYLPQTTASDAVRRMQMDENEEKG